MTRALPAPIVATLDDLPPVAAEAIRNARALPEDGVRSWVDAAGVRLSALGWGRPDGRPLLLVHGVTSSARTFWRLGPVFAALGRRAVALDLPGHGRTGGGEDGRGFRFIETAGVLAAFARSVFGDDAAAMAVIGHSWGAMLTAHLPIAGLRPGRLVLLDPPVMERTALQAVVEEPDSRPDTSPERALATIRNLKPGWSDGDQVVKAEALTQLVAAAAVAVLLGNGDWDGGLTALADPAANGIPTWIVRGEDATGSLTPASWLPRFADRIGADHILTIFGGEHSPQRDRIEATTLALLRALDG